MHYEHGKQFTCTIKGQARQLKDFGYPISSQEKNQFELNNLSLQKKEKITYDDKDFSMDTVSDVSILHLPARERREDRLVIGIFKYAIVGDIHCSDKAMGIDTIKRSNGNYKFKKLF